VLGTDGRLARVEGGHAAILDRPALPNGVHCIGFDPFGLGTVVAQTDTGVLRQSLDGTAPMSRWPIENRFSSCQSLVIAQGAGTIVSLPADYEPITILKSGPSGETMTQWPNPLRAPSGLRTSLGSGRLSADGHLLAAVSNGREVALMNLDDKRLLGVFGVGNVQALALSADASRMLTFGESGLLSWSIGPEAVARAALTLSGQP
jgi:hypothetical protein